MTDKAKEIEAVFVYGTLRAGEHNDSRLEGAEFVGYGVLIGEYKMVDLGSFPAVVEDEGAEWVISGEVYRVTPATLYGALDRLESVDILDPEDRDDEARGLYYRRELDIQIGDETVKAWVYLMRPRRVWGDAEEIVSGDWLKRMPDYRTASNE